MSLFPMIGFTALSELWFIRSLIDVRFFRETNSRNRLTFEESSRADFYFVTFYTRPSNFYFFFIKAVFFTPSYSFYN